MSACLVSSCIYKSKRKNNPQLNLAKDKRINRLPVEENGKREEGAIATRGVI